MNKKIINIFAAIILFAALSVPKKLYSMEELIITNPSEKLTWGEWFTGLYRKGMYNIGLGVKEPEIKISTIDELTKQGYEENVAEKIIQSQQQNQIKAQSVWQGYLSGKSNFTVYQDDISLIQAEVITETNAILKWSELITQYEDKLTKISNTLNGIEPTQQNLAELSQEIKNLETKMAQNKSVQAALNKNTEFTNLLEEIKSSIETKKQELTQTESLLSDYKNQLDTITNELNILDPNEESYGQNLNDLSKQLAELKENINNDESAQTALENNPEFANLLENTSSQIQNKIKEAIVTMLPKKIYSGYNNNINDMFGQLKNNKNPTEDFLNKFLDEANAVESSITKDQTISNTDKNKLIRRMTRLKKNISRLQKNILSELPSEPEPTIKTEQQVPLQIIVQKKETTGWEKKTLSGKEITVQSQLENWQTELDNLNENYNEKQFNGLKNLITKRLESDDFKNLSESEQAIVDNIHTTISDIEVKAKQPSTIRQQAEYGAAWLSDLISGYKSIFTQEVMKKLKTVSQYFNKNDPLPSAGEPILFEQVIQMQPNENIAITSNFKLPRLEVLSSSDFLIVEGNPINLQDKNNNSYTFYLYDFDNNNTDTHLIIWANESNTLSVDDVKKFISNYVIKYNVNVNFIAIKSDIKKFDYTQFTNLIFSEDKPLTFNEETTLQTLIQSASQIHTFGGGNTGALIKNALDKYIYLNNPKSPSTSYANGDSYLYGIQWGANLSNKSNFLTEISKDIFNSQFKNLINVYSDNDGNSSGIKRSYKDSNYPSIVNVKLRQAFPATGQGTVGSYIYDMTMEQMENFLFRNDGYFTIRDLTDPDKLYYKAEISSSYDLLIAVYENILYPTLYARDGEKNIFMRDINSVLQTIANFATQHSGEQLQASINTIIENTPTTQLFKLFSYRATAQFGNNANTGIQYKPAKEGAVAKGISVVKGASESLIQLVRTTPEQKTYWWIAREQEIRAEKVININTNEITPQRVEQTTISAYDQYNQDSIPVHLEMYAPEKFENLEKFSITNQAQELFTTSLDFYFAKDSEQEGILKTDFAEIKKQKKERQTELTKKMISQKTLPFIDDILIYYKNEKALPPSDNFFKKYASYYNKNILVIFVNKQHGKSSYEADIDHSKEIADMIYNDYINVILQKENQHLDRIFTFAAEDLFVGIKNSIDIILYEKLQNTTVSMHGVQWSNKKVESQYEANQEYTHLFENQINIYSDDLTYDKNVFSQIRNIKIKKTNTKLNPLSAENISDYLFNHNGFFAIQDIKDNLYNRQEILDDHSYFDDFYIAYDNQTQTIYPMLHYKENDSRESLEEADEDGWISFDTFFSRKVIEILTDPNNPFKIWYKTGWRYYWDWQATKFY